MTLGVVLAILNPVLPVLVRGVEKLFGHKTGEVKADVVFTSVRKIADDLAAAGKIAGLPDDSILKQAIEAVVGNLNASGELRGEATVVHTPTNEVQEGVALILSGVSKLIGAKLK